MATFISYRRPMRTRRTALEMLVTLALAIGACGFAAWQFANNPVASSIGIVAAIVVGVVAISIFLSQLAAFVRGTEYTIELTDAGVDANGEHWPWENVVRINATLQRSTNYGFMNVTVCRAGRSRLTHLVELTDGQSEAAINALKEHLQSQHQHIQWILRDL